MTKVKNIEEAKDTSDEVKDQADVTSDEKEEVDVIHTRKPAQDKPKRRFTPVVLVLLLAIPVMLILAYAVFDNEISGFISTLKDNERSPQGTSGTVATTGNVMQSDTQANAFNPSPQAVNTQPYAWSRQQPAYQGRQNPLQTADTMRQPSESIAEKNAPFMSSSTFPSPYEKPEWVKQQQQEMQQQQLEARREMQQQMIQRQQEMQQAMAKQQQQMLEQQQAFANSARVNPMWPYNRPFERQALRSQPSYNQFAVPNQAQNLNQQHEAGNGAIQPSHTPYYSYTYPPQPYYYAHPGYYGHPAYYRPYPYYWNSPVYR